MSKRDKQLPRLVMIEWLDSHYAPGWSSGASPKAGMLCRSVGWLTHDGKKAKTIAAHVTHETAPQRAGQMTIPCCAVVRVRALK